MKRKIEKYFGIKEKGSSINVELLAGLSTFMSLAYIVVVNPAILSEGGINKSAVFFATIIVSGVFTIIMGLKAKLPFALAPGLEMDAYVAFYIVGVLGFSWQQGLAIVFYSTLIFFILSYRGIRKKIIESIPENMKHALAASVGMFLVMIGLKLSNIVAFEGASPIGIGDLTGKGAITLYIGLLVIIILEKVLKFKGSILLSIIAMAIYANFVGIADDMKPAEFSMEMFSAVGSFWSGMDVILDPRSWAPILILFLVDFYGSVAKIIGLTVNTDILSKKGSKNEKIDNGLYVDGFAALVSPIIGTSSVTTFVESSVGIKEGGRTGLTAVTTGVLLLSCIFLTPLIKFVPVVATSSALIWVGLWLMPNGMIKFLSDDDTIWKRFVRSDKIILALMLLVVLLSFSLQYALIIGYVGYVIHEFIKYKKANIYLVASMIVLIIGTIAQWLT
ncbi:Adenine permease AdeQ [Kordia antarctica]|uniref:Adenine permease AdeQ n=1 Tax=Kordia antarctica TaxID=1218801 RepID=A0A7L4ZHK0_9FLAO|nr:NCS2 family permease [Kordia antarctica]QHI35961.1 Adenine permease AdeQ [Kordia antarctica]